MIIAIDANILIALMQDTSFQYAFKTFHKQHDVSKVILPTPAMCEFLSYDNIDRFQFVKTKSNLLVVADFDQKSAVTTARLAVEYYKDRIDNVERQKVKVDLQILGTAIANNATHILTKDNDFKKYIERLKLDIELKSIKDLSIKSDLFKN